MKRLLLFCLWLLVFAGALFAIDQTLVRIPLHPPVLREIQVFYRDVRGRLLGLRQQPPSATSIEALIEQDRAGQTTSSPAPTRASSGKPAAAEKPAKAGYLYLDDQGELKIADRLEAIPPKFRRNAQPLIP